MLHLLRWETATHQGSVTWQVPGIVCDQKYSCERQSWGSGKRKSQSSKSTHTSRSQGWTDWGSQSCCECVLLENNMAKWRLTLVKWQISIAYRLTVFVTVVCACHSQRINFRAIQERHKETILGDWLSASIDAEGTAPQNDSQKATTWYDKRRTQAASGYLIHRVDAST